MTGMLASVDCLEEALLALSAKIDILDLKAPNAGSLGALPVALVKEIVATVNARCPTSATIGDLPMQPDLIYPAVAAMAETGVDYVKIGFFPDGDLVPILEKLTPIAVRQKLIAVLFADSQPDLQVIDAIKVAGFSGAMLDTLDKGKGSLTEIMPVMEIARFVNYTKSRRLISGLAGSLRLDDIPILLPHQPDYLGFRGALCGRRDRTSRIDVQSLNAVRQAITPSA